MHKLTITGRIPSKKNSKQLVHNGGRAFLIPSKKHKEWHDDAEYQVSLQWPKRLILSTLKLVTLTFYSPDKIKGDLTNKAESVMDLLVDMGVIRDDNWFEIGAINLRFGGVDKANPRVEIVLEIVGDL